MRGVQGCPDTRPDTHPSAALPSILPPLPPPAPVHFPPLSPNPDSHPQHRAPRERLKEQRASWKKLKEHRTPRQSPARSRLLLSCRCPSRSARGPHKRPPNIWAHRCALLSGEGVPEGVHGDNLCGVQEVQDEERRGETDPGGWRRRRGAGGARGAGPRSAPRDPSSIQGGIRGRTRSRSNSTGHLPAILPRDPPNHTYTHARPWREWQTPAPRVPGANAGGRAGIPGPGGAERKESFGKAKLTDLGRRAQCSLERQRRRRRAQHRGVVAGGPGRAAHPAAPVRSRPRSGAGCHRPDLGPGAD